MWDIVKYSFYGACLTFWAVLAINFIVCKPIGGL